MENIINSNVLKKLYSKSTDVLIRPIEIRGENPITVTLFCVDGLVNSQMLDLTILKPLATEEGPKQCKSQIELANYLLNDGGAYHAFGSFVTDFNQLNTMVMSGMCAIVLDDIQCAVVYDVRTFDKRSVSEPSEESTMKGAKDSFIEVLRTNTALIRRRIRSPHLTIEQMYIGRLSRTDVALVYMNNICDMNLVDQIRKKLQAIDIDNISASSFIEEFISENKNSLLPQVMYTERPDRCCSNLTDGRIVLVVDGIPFVYILPCQFPMLLQSTEDYSENYLAGSSLRFLRYLTLLVSLLLPAFYIAVTTFHSQ
ncbi:MAG: spore germination protein, partial [Clostridium sp.]|nr:spore germination protein [Clostridium sp.]